MSQRNKFRREFITKDGNGNIIDVPDDLIAGVLLVGAAIRDPDTIVNGGTEWVTLYHPGRIKPQHSVFIYSSSAQETYPIGDTPKQSLFVQATRLNGTIWEAQLINNSGADISFSGGDRLVLNEASSENAYATLFHYDTATAEKSNPHTVVEGVLDFFTNETDVDIRLYASTGTEFGYLLDMHTGGRRLFINPADWGAAGDGVTDDTVALQQAINYAEDNQNRKVTIKVSAGTYLISSTLLLTDDTLEWHMDNGASLLAAPGFSDSFMMSVLGDDVVIYGGELDGDGAAPYGIEITGDRCSVDKLRGVDLLVASIRSRVCTGTRIFDVRTLGGSYGVLIDGSTNAQVLFCSIRDMAVAGVIVIQTAGDSQDIEISQNYIDGTGSGADADGVYVGGLIADQSNIDGVIISNNRISNVDGKGINAKNATLVSVDHNKLRNIGGAPASGSNHAINLDGCIASHALFNTIKVVNGRGINVIGTDNVAARNSVIGNTVTSAEFAGLNVANSEDFKFALNDFQGNALDGGATFEVLLAADTLRSIIGLNTIGTGGLDIAAGATYEIGHNWEL